MNPVAFRMPLSFQPPVRRLRVRNLHALVFPVAQRREMFEMLRSSYAEAFNTSGSDDLDVVEEDYLDEPV